MGHPARFISPFYVWNVALLACYPLLVMKWMRPGPAGRAYSKLGGPDDLSQKARV